jgi:gliding motility-associated-like protein
MKRIIFSNDLEFNQNKMSFQFIQFTFKIHSRSVTSLILVFFLLNIGIAQTTGPCSNPINIPNAPGLNYRPYGITVAGSNSSGTATDQVNNSRALAIDAAGNIYVAEFKNNRVQKWAPGARFGVTVAGGNGAGSADNQFDGPWGLAVDAAGNIYVSDYYNHRVQKWVQGATSGTTVAGGNGWGAAADRLAYPAGLFVDGVGNIYVADMGNHRVQKWAPNARSGTTVAGGNGSGSTANKLDNPASVAVDAAGNIYVADSKNHRVQRWAPNASSGTTVAGGNGSGRAANQLELPYGVVIDDLRNVYVADFRNARIQKWAPGALSGTTVAGGNALGSAANQLNGPYGLVIDAAKNLYISDHQNLRIQKWAPGASSGITVAGNVGGNAAANQLNSPRGQVVVDASGNIYVADTYNDRVQKWAPGASFGTTVAGGNGQGSASNQLDLPMGVAVDAAGNVYVADTYNNRIQKWAPGATSGTTVAGGNGQGSNSNQFSQPVGITLDAVGNFYIADYNNHRIQKWVPGARIGTTVAGGNGQGSASNQFDGVYGVAIDQNGNLYIPDVDNNRVQRWAPGAITGTTVAGGNGEGYGDNQISSATGVAIDNNRNIYVSSYGTSRIQKWASGATFGTTVAGGNGAGSDDDQLDGPYGLAVDAAKSIYIVDYNNHRVQKWSIEDTITLCVGSTASALYAIADAGNTLRWYGTNATGGVGSTNATIPSTTTAGIFNYYVSQVSTATGCESPRTRITVVVNGFTFNPLPTQNSLCGSSMILNAGAGFTSYLWNTGATSQTITATTSGEYRVTVTNALGCSASDTINVSLVKADILQSDQTICSNTPLTLSVNSYVSQSAKTIDFDNVGIAALDVTGGTASLITGLSGNGLAITRPAEVRTKDQTFTYGDYEVDAKTGTNTSNQYLSVLLPLNSWTNEAISIDSRPSGTDDVGWGVYVNGVRVAFASGSHPANASSWYKMKIRVTPDSVKCWINSTLLYQGLNTTVPRNIGAVKLSTFSTSHFDNLKYTPYQTFSSVLWSTSATTSTISVTPTATTTYFATISDGISSCTDSVKITVNNLVGFNPLQDTVKLCGDRTVLDAGAGFTAYNWSNGFATRTITVNATGKYVVSVTNATGCSASDTSYVSILKSKILQSDTTICNGSSIKLSIDSIFSSKKVCNINDLPFNLQNGLVAYFPFCGNANDATGNGNNGIVKGARLTRDRFNNDLSAYEFSSSSDNSITGVLNTPLGSLFTISFWVKRNTNQLPGGSVQADKEWMFSSGNSQVGGATNIGITNNSRSLRYGPWGNDGNDASYVIDNSWQHIVQTYSNGQFKIFVNGKLYNTSTEAVNLQNGAFSIGCQLSPFLQQGFDGVIDDVILYNRDLSANEISSLFNAGTPPIISWSTGATTSSIFVSPNIKTTYKVTVTDGINSCTDSVVVNVNSSELKLTNPAPVCSPGIIDLTAAGVTVGSASGLTFTYWKDSSATQALANPDKVSVSGTYYIVGKSATGCTSLATAIKVTVNPLPVATIVTPAQTTICDKSSLTLTARGGTAYQWLINGSAIAGANDSIYIASQAGNYEVNVISQGCTSKAPTAVKVTVNPLPVATIFAPNQTAICDKSTIRLTASGGTTYQWLFNGSIIAGATDSSFAASQAGSYEVNVISQGCTSKAPTAVKVTVNPLPVATIFAPNQTAICDKSTIRLTASGGTTYQWLFNGSIIAGATDSSFAASQAGSYEVNVIAKGCTSKVAAPVNLTLIKAAVPKFSNSSTCIDVPVSFFNETDTTASGSVNYVWDLGDGQTSTLFNPVYTYKKSGAFVVKLKVAPKLCSSLSDSVTKSITVDVPPVGIKYPNVLAVKNKATPLSARFIANGYSYLWTPSTGLNNGAIQKPVFNASQEQLYRVRLTSAGGCITMDTVKVSVYDSSDIFVPKAFSPNKDGKNDLLQPFLVNIVTLKFFKVYNRWGQLMFQSSDSRQGWDGMYNYKPQPLETYTWIAEGVDGNGTTIFRKGQTVLIR